MITLRRITDMSTLMAWRREVVSAVFDVKAGKELMDANGDYYLRHVADGSHRAYVASFGGEEAGCCGVCFSDELPSPDNPTGRCAYLMNIYVREPYRQHGVAERMVRMLVEIAVEADCGKIYLESTPMAKNLYRSCGFTEMKDMMKYGNTGD